jgi:hypothetical protein
MSDRPQSAQALRQDHPSTFHAFFLAAKESGYTEFDLQLVTSPNGKIEFCICPRGHCEMSAKFDVRGNTVRASASEASVGMDEADVSINYGGTRSGEVPRYNRRRVLAFPPRRYGDRSRPTEDGLEPLGGNFD